MKTNTSRKPSAFTLVEIMIVVAIIALLAAIAIPRYVQARATAQRSICVANLQLIKIAKASYARECNLTNGTVLSDTIVHRLEMDKKLCPSGGAYIYDVIGEDPKCSKEDQGHFLSVDVPRTP